jgi:hypothetical protein
VGHGPWRRGGGCLSNRRKASTWFTITQGTGQEGSATGQRGTRGRGSGRRTAVVLQAFLVSHATVTGIAPKHSIWNCEACGAPRRRRVSQHGGGAVRASHVQTISLQATRGWLPPLLWMAVMLWLSTDTFAAERTGGLLWPLLSVLAPRVTDAQYALLHFFIRKSAHGTEYALLALLLLRAFRGGVAAAWQ